jgi:hypothetical protein
MLEHGSCIVLELGLIFTFDPLCRAHFIYWYVYIYLSSIAEMRSQYSREVPDGCQMHTLICPHIIIAQFICTHRLCAPTVVPGGKCIYLLDYLQFDPLTSLPSTCASACNLF